MDKLSPKQEQILHLIMQGLTTPHIARRLSMSPHTVISHRKRILEKLEAYNMPQAVYNYMEMQIENLDGFKYTDPL